MKREYVVAALAVLALLVASWFGYRGEEPPKAATRASADDSFGGYHAWYELLEREGVRVERFRRHHDALRASDAGTLIAAYPQAPLKPFWDASERDALKAWIRRGGRLIDIGLTPPVDRDDGDGELITGTQVVERRRPRAGVDRLRGAWAPLVGTLSPRDATRLVPVGKRAHVETLLADGRGTLVARYRMGRGEVIAVSDPQLFENRTIGRAGNARLAYLLASSGAATVAFDEAIRGDVVEKPWYRALDAPELVALAIAALAGVLWLAYGIMPLGPAVPMRPPREPTSAEFVDAVAALYERARARDRARDALARAARRALDRAPKTKSNAALAERVAAAASEPMRSDAALIAFAGVARAAREKGPAMNGRRTAWKSG